VQTKSGLGALDMHNRTVGVWMDVSTPKHPDTFCLVDRDDWLTRLRFNKWSLDGNGYAVAKIGGRKTLLHRLVTRAKKGQVVDHIDGDRLNNLRSNLRVAGMRENRWNCPGRGGSSACIGVGWRADLGKWRAQIRKRHLGYFSSELDAARAYNAAAAEVYGEYARLNDVA
jgi:hypothetical protein